MRAKVGVRASKGMAFDKGESLRDITIKMFALRLSNMLVIPQGAYEAKFSSVLESKTYHRA